MTETSSRTNACSIPTSLPPEESAALCEMRRLVVDGYCSVRQRAHYDGEPEPKHKCLGTITMTHEHVTFNCPLCGDERRVL